MILVIGGAGYVGSHTIKALLMQGHRVVVLDNLSTGHHVSLDKRVVFERGDVGNPRDLDRVFSRYSVDAVVHLGFSHPKESEALNSKRHYMKRTNHCNMLLRKMQEYDIMKLVISSTTDVYRAYYNESITEAAQLSNQLPHMRALQLIEERLEDMHQRIGFQYAVLRYHNAVGSFENGELGEDHHHEAHLIPKLFKHILEQKDERLVLGSEYVYSHEYLHIMDVVQAHVLSIERMLDDRHHVHGVYNLGTGQPTSIRDILTLTKQISGQQLDVLYYVQPARLTVSYEKIQNELGWQPLYSLEEAMNSAWQWHMRNPQGYLPREELALSKLLKM
ncbi:NAD-dependent epimerase/dehydratase family protein [Ectobacillus sp. sgz5001026]|uniref:NAD-dependent epimerase/dehydratase family protein n=1 Tax=Ectobacillus sp. sgz5001026 TaxID=3242473 RepID=UPI0036D27469